MGNLTTAREALLAEALGELTTLLERLEGIGPALDTSRESMTQSSANLASQVAKFETRMATITENAKVVAVRHIAQRTDEMARSSCEAQTRAMEEAARMLFRTELGPALQRFAMPIQHLADLAQRGAHPWQHWLTHAATAAVASALSWALAACLWAR